VIFVAGVMFVTALANPARERLTVLSELDPL
jgi:hypothetical protein